MLSDNFHKYFSEAELGALRLDGQVTRSLLPIDACDDYRARSRRVLGDYREKLILTSQSALWAHGIGDEPRIHSASQHGVRVKLTHATKFVLEQRAFRDGDVWGNVTSPLRTVTDILRTAENVDNEQLRALCQLTGITTVEIAEKLSTLGTTPGLTLANLRLGQMADVPLNLSPTHPSETR